MLGLVERIGGHPPGRQRARAKWSEEGDILCLLCFSLVWRRKLFLEQLEFRAHVSYLSSMALITSWILNEFKTFEKVQGMTKFKHPSEVCICKFSQATVDTLIFCTLILWKTAQQSNIVFDIYLPWLRSVSWHEPVIEMVINVSVILHKSRLSRFDLYEMWAPGVRPCLFLHSASVTCTIILTCFVFRHLLKWI